MVNYVDKIKVYISATELSAINFVDIDGLGHHAYMSMSTPAQEFQLACETCQKTQAD